MKTVPSFVPLFFCLCLVLHPPVVCAFISNHGRMTMIQDQSNAPADIQRMSVSPLYMARNEVRSGFAMPDLRNLFTLASSSTEEGTIIGSNKQRFLHSLEKPDTLNVASKERTSLLNTLIDEKVMVADMTQNRVSRGEDKIVPSLSLENPGSKIAFSAVAPGTWKVIYAPHMTTISGLFGGNFDVQYTLFEDGSMTSHARYDFPIVGEGYLSVSGTYGSVNDAVSRVDFDKAWVKPFLQNNDEDDRPYRSLEEVPSGVGKDLINGAVKLVFIDAVAVFPVSFLDDDMIVFDFDLLGTRICAKKI